MIRTRTFEVTPGGEKEVLWHYDDVTDSVTIETIVDVELLGEMTKHARNSVERGTKHGDGLHHIASIPDVIMTQLYAQGIIDDQDPKKKKLLNWIRENPYFALRHGRYA